jgi:hypothetical protein
MLCWVCGGGVFEGEDALDGVELLIQIPSYDDFG